MSKLCLCCHVCLSGPEIMSKLCLCCHVCLSGPEIMSKYVYAVMCVCQGLRS